MRLILSIVLSLAALTGCAPNPAEDGDTGADAAVTKAPPVVTLVTREYSIAAPPEIASGWTTFELTNDGEQEHFAYIYRLPDDKTYEQFRSEFYQPFSEVWQEYVNGDLTREEAGAKFGEVLPEWFFTGVTPSGGPGLTEVGETALATMNLDPGTYVIECYVKMPDGGWHTDMGMQRELTVTAEATGADPPAADAEITLSNYEIVVSGEVTSGEQTVAVHVVDTPEGFMPHDLNLFRLSDDVEVDEIVAWMDWMDLTQFRAPGPGYSLGGMKSMAAGKTGYITIDLEPGSYAWVSENYAPQGMVETFTVEAATETAAGAAS